MHRESTLWSGYCCLSKLNMSSSHFLSVSVTKSIYKGETMDSIHQLITPSKVNRTSRLLEFYFCPPSLAILPCLKVPLASHKHLIASTHISFLLQFKTYFTCSQHTQPYSIEKKHNIVVWVTTYRSKIQPCECVCTILSSRS